MRYTGKLFYPRDAELTADLASLSPIQGHTAYRLYGELKAAMEEDLFGATIDASGAAEPLKLRFSRIGQTAAYAAFTRDADDTAEKLEAVVAILPRLDREEDEAVLDELHASPQLDMIDESDWADARSESGPMAAAFFTSQTALNDPLIHGMMSLVGAAFLDRLGLLD